ncbi:hypothetical protein BAUCODRAFT_144169 [Baudoinia panamericana UAMH 10762]|uniref:LPXTG-motif cell wall anchor domain protein n=1 Tax=Baudoinia panamericana (strain UAMH 10762) TaxID=717646 RepID=M2M0J5_BAUPA|nr:uncharacterized protein BAUCODRAFT_144169 [Baudoinia panamericana UAMH 10762]EMD00508.1 hypothetical protein BAUCODRAFT_144169 [Baudoinia panamericana UAMH 10762]
MASDDERSEAQFYDAQDALVTLNAGHPSTLPESRGENVATTADSPTTTRLNALRVQHHRHSLQDVPALPAIPAKYLENGRPASISVPALHSIPRASGRARDIEDGGAQRGRARRAKDAGPLSRSKNGVDTVTLTVSAGHCDDNLVTKKARQRSLPALAPRPQRQLSDPERTSDLGAPETMARRGKDGDLFLELAHDDAQDEVRPLTRAASRLSQFNSRRSLPPEGLLSSAADRRPRSSGSLLQQRPVSRFSGYPTEGIRSAEKCREPFGRSSLEGEDNASVSGRSTSSRARPYIIAPERPDVSARMRDRARSPEVHSFSRRRPSYGQTSPQLYKGRQSQLASKANDSQDDSPAGSSEPKADSASVESQTDTVWDELDDLKSRIKKLELTGKHPPTSGVAVSGSSSERPRTATTAPTTIDLSPKHEQKSDGRPTTQSDSGAQAVGALGATNIHPTLHTALAKAKPLLNPTLYRTLEATAADALQLAAMTGSNTGPHGTTFSAASIINGGSERHVRRKADTMCRNLTDLCLALCEGKHEASSVATTPINLEPVRSSPTIRYSRSSIGGHGDTAVPVSRPMSRLEARRTSILGVLPNGSVSGNSRRESADDVSASEQEGTPSQADGPQRELRHVGRASSRLLSARLSRQEDVSGDEDPTTRPASRAMTDAGGSRNRPSASSDYARSPRTAESPRFRETLTARRTNGSAFEANKEHSRVASLSSDVGRKRWTRESTPPVLEEELNEAGEYQPSSQPKRRLTSLGQFSARRAAEMPSRAASLSSRRHVVEG